MPSAKDLLSMGQPGPRPATAVEAKHSNRGDLWVPTQHLAEIAKRADFKQALQDEGFGGGGGGGGGTPSAHAASHMSGADRITSLLASDELSQIELSAGGNGYFIGDTFVADSNLQVTGESTFTAAATFGGIFAGTITGNFIGGGFGGDLGLATGSGSVSVGLYDSGAASITGEAFYATGLSGGAVLSGANATLTANSEGAYLTFSDATNVGNLYAAGGLWIDAAGITINTLDDAPININALDVYFLGNTRQSAILGNNDSVFGGNLYLANASELVSIFLDGANEDISLSAGNAINLSAGAINVSSSTGIGMSTDSALNLQALSYLALNSESFISLQYFGVEGFRVSMEGITVSASAAFNEPSYFNADASFNSAAYFSEPLYCDNGVELTPQTVGSLPSPGGRRGQSRYVTDSNTVVFNAIVAGGGSNAIRVTSDGTNWRIG